MVSKHTLDPEIADFTSQIKNCPIEFALNCLGKKWTLHIIRDLFTGKSRFKDFLHENPKLSTKMLSLRLKELQEMGVIQKVIIQTTPVLIEYHLTEKGKSLKPILIDLLKFSIEFYPEEVYYHPPPNPLSDLDKFVQVLS